MASVLTYLSSLAFDDRINNYFLTSQLIFADFFKKILYWRQSILKYQIMSSETTIIYHNFCCYHYCSEWTTGYRHQQIVCSMRSWKQKSLSIAFKVCSCISPLAVITWPYLCFLVCFCSCKYTPQKPNEWKVEVTHQRNHCLCGQVRTPDLVMNS